MTDTSQQAFPSISQSIDKGTSGANIDHVIDPGMTLRDYFAAKVMGSLIGAQIICDQGIHPDSAQLLLDSLASLSYHCAAAMLKAREA